MAAVAALVDQEIVVPDTGSTRADLLVLMREAVALYSGELAPRLMPNLVMRWRSVQSWRGPSAAAI